MNWEETILYIRSKNEFSAIVENSYLSEDLVDNVARYFISDEFNEILKYINSNNSGLKLLDVGSGNGITAVAFALKGFDVTVVEPDNSETIGCGAIEYLKKHYKLSNLNILCGFCENMNLVESSFDIVFARQSMHHAYDLNGFVSEMSRVLKSGGIFLSIRDHVVFNEDDKNQFLSSHDLHKFYGGENAFSPIEYRTAIANAGLKLKNELKYYDSVINYYPKSEYEILNMHTYRVDKARKYLSNKFGFFSFLLTKIYCLKNGINVSSTYDESKVPGRMYSYVAIKK
jgi:ubiquinone/menaquinone biosynthesis C-methylase UbiE